MCKICLFCTLLTDFKEFSYIARVIWSAQSPRTLCCVEIRGFLRWTSLHLFTIGRLLALSETANVLPPCFCSDMHVSHGRVLEPVRRCDTLIVVRINLACACVAEPHQI